MALEDVEHDEVNGAPVVDDVLGAGGEQQQPDAPESEAKPETETRAEETQAQPAAQQEEFLDPRLITRAVRAGLDYEDVRGFGNSAALMRTVEHLERLMTEKFGQQQPPKDEFELPPALAGEMYTKEEIERDAAWRNAFGKLAGKLKDQEQFRNQSSSDAQQRALIERADWFDGKIAALGGDFAPELGTGKWNDGKLTGQSRATRSRIWTLADAIEQTLGCSRDEAFDAAIRAGLGDKFDRRAVKQVQSKMQARSKQRTFAGAGAKRDTTPSDDLANNPEIVDAWNKAREESGSR